MSDQERRSWPVNPFCCSNPDSLEYHCFLAFTVSRDALKPKATGFDDIENPYTRQLFHLFLEICSRMSVARSGGATCAMEQVLNARGTSVVHYTFYLAVHDWRGCDSDPCESVLHAVIADAVTHSAKLRQEHSKPWQAWHALTSLSRIKSCLQRHTNHHAPSARHESGEEWSGERLSAHLIFSLAHAFMARDQYSHASQNLWAPDPYVRDDRFLNFPKPRFVYVLHDEELREPSLLYSRLLPDWQAQCTPSTVIQFADALLMPAGDRARCFDRLESIPVPENQEGMAPPPEQRARDRVSELHRQTLGLVIDMKNAHQIVEGHPIYSQAHTYDIMRKHGLERLARVQAVAENKSLLGRLPHPINAARRLYDVNQRLGIEMHVAHMRGAFPDNISPQTRALMTFADEHLFAGQKLPHFPRLYSDLDRFCEREVWRWQQFSETYLLASHNVNIMMFISYASLDAYSFQLVDRVGLNVLLLSEEGGLSKSMMIKNILELIRNKLRIITYMTGKAKAVSSRFGEQAYNMCVMEELSENLVSDKGPSSANEAARIYKAMLSNPMMRAEYLHIDRATGERESRADESIWIGCMLAAGNIEGLLSWKMPPPVRDRHIPVTVDQSDRAKRRIVDKMDQASVKKRDPAFIQHRDEVSMLFKKEEFVYAEARMLERETSVRPVSDDVASVVCNWLSHELEVSGHAPCARNRDKICALACVVAGLDAVDGVYFDEGGLAADAPYDVRAQPLVERRSWVKAAHMVHVVGMAPYLFVDVDERDVRLALCAEFESMPLNKWRFAPSSRPSSSSRRGPPTYATSREYDENDCSERDPTYASFVAGRRGLHDLAARLQRRLRDCKDRRSLLTRDAIQFRLQEWMQRTSACRDWTVARNDRWPVEEHDEEPSLRPLASLVESPGGSRVYYVQTSWIHRDKLPDPAHVILLKLLQGLFAHRHQGGFSAPFGADPRKTRLDIVAFPKASRDARPLIVPGYGARPAREFDVDMDTWGVQQHNERLYIDRTPMRRMRGFSSADERDSNCYFAGRPLSDILPQRAVNLDVAMQELIAEPDQCGDDDACDEAYITGDLNYRPRYHWEDWWQSEEPGEPWPDFVRPRPDDPPDVVRAKHAHCRGSYKELETLPKIEESRISQRLRYILNRPSAERSWQHQQENEPRISHKRKWRDARTGAAATTRVGKLRVPDV
jgi:hypothetical protein